MESIVRLSQVDGVLKNRFTLNYKVEGARLIVDVSVKYSNFSDVIREVVIPITGGSQTITIDKKPTSLDINGEPDEFIDVVKFTFSDELDFELTQEMTKEDLEDYLEILRRFIMQL